jgi:hypothetical protein
MAKRKGFVVFLSLFLALAFVVGAYNPAAAAFVTKTTYSIGDQGINVPAGFDPDIFYIKRTGGAQGVVHFTRTPIEIVMKQGGVIPFTYVFFDLKPWEARAYRDGELHIYSKNPNNDTWTTCSSFVINAVAQDVKTAISPQGTFGTSDNRVRIACVATAATIYGIGSKTLPRIAPTYGVAGS